MLKFKLIDKCWQNAVGESTDGADFFLEKMNGMILAIIPCIICMQRVS